MDPQWKEGKYILFESEDSLGLIENTPDSLSKQKACCPEMRIVKKFTARCMCEAVQQFTQHFWDENYNMCACHQDKQNGDEVCPHYSEMVKLTGSTPDDKVE